MAFVFTCLPLIPTNVCLDGVHVSERRNTMRTWLFIGIVVLAFAAGACTDTFLVYKNGYGYFVGSSSNAKYDLLCKSGDLEKVLASSQLSKELKEDLFKYNCSPERSGEKVKQIYASMTVDERKDIKRAFRSNGFDINYLPC
jgi:hypothetical protein